MTDPHTPDTPGKPTARRGPSRDMLGGPVLGVLVFLLVAVLLGWGLISALDVQLGTTVQDATTADVTHRFEPGRVYVLEQDLLLGVTTHADPTRAVVLFPDRDGLPRDTLNRRLVPLLADAKNDPGRYPDILGIVEAGTRIRFSRLIHDAHNRQTPYIAELVLLDGPFAEQTVTGLHLEAEASGGSEGGGVVLVPRPDLFREVPAAEGETGATDQPIQSPETEPAPPGSP